MRQDGKRVKNADPMHLIMPYIMTRRYDAMNMITVDIPVEPMQAYIREARQQGRALSHMGLIIAAYLRTVAQYPEMNRFVVNKRLYARNEVAVGMVVLKPGHDDGTMSKIFFEKTDTVFDVQEKIDRYIEQNRQLESDNATDKLMEVLLKLPGLMGIVIGVLKWMDKHGLLPKSLIDASPFHTSMVISNLASIRTNHVYHHVYDFGTTSMIVTIGNMREVPKRVKGEIVFERCLPLGVVTDERICSGSYFAQVFRRVRMYLQNPALLESPPQTIIEDV